MGELDPLLLESHHAKFQFIWMRNGWDIRGLVFRYSAALHGTLQCCAAGTLFWLYTCPCLKSKQWTCSKPEFHAVLQNRMCCNFAWWLSMLKGPPLLNLNLIWVWPCSVPSCLSIFSHILPSWYILAYPRILEINWIWGYLRAKSLFVIVKVLRVK